MPRFLLLRRLQCHLINANGSGSLSSCPNHISKQRGRRYIYGWIVREEIYITHKSYQVDTAALLFFSKGGVKAHIPFCSRLVKICGNEVDTFNAELQDMTPKKKWFQKDALKLAQSYPCTRWKFKISLPLTGSAGSSSRCSIPSSSTMVEVKLAYTAARINFIARIKRGKSQHLRALDFQNKTS